MIEKKMLRNAALAALVGCGAATPAQPPKEATSVASKDDATALFAAYKAATGGALWDKVTSEETKLAISAGGMNGTGTGLLDVMNGRSRSRFALGVVAGASGFDGKVAWELDPGGEVRTLDATDARQSARTSAWMGAMSYWYPARGAATFGPVIEVTEGGKSYRVVTATPEGGHPITLFFDAATQYLARTVEKQGGDTLTTRFDDYQLRDGLRVPLLATTDTTDAAGRTDQRQRTEQRTLEMKLNVPVADSDFATPAMVKTAHVDDPSGVTHVKFELVNNHIYADAFVNGAKLRLLVDTGGANILSPKAAERLGVHAEGKFVASGAGDEKVDVGMARLKEVKLGTAVLDNPVFMVMDLGAFDSIEGVSSDGLVGFEMFRRFRVTVDYAGRDLVIAEPSKFVAPSGAHVVPFELAERMPVVAGALDGLPIRVSVDTGSRASLTLNGPFVKEHALAAKYTAAPERITGWGVGGAARGRPARLGLLTIGDLTVHDVAGDLFTGDKGAFANPDLSGNLGAGVLKRFTVSFDYDAKKMYLAPNSDFAKPDQFDRSGMWLLADGDSLRVVGVAPDSAALHAHLAEDDRITSVDGEAVARRTLADWRLFFAERPGGTKVVLNVVGSGKEKGRTVTLELADAIPPHAVVH